MKQIAIDISPLHALSAGRGIGVYVRELFAALQEHQTSFDYQLIKEPGAYAADLIHYPFFDFYFHTLPIKKKAPTIVTIHDVIPLIFKERYPAGIKGTVKFQLQKAALQSVKAIITDSKTSALDIHQTLGFDSQAIYPIHLAAASNYYQASDKDIAASRQQYQLTRPYFLYVGDINYNKNVSGLIQAYASFQETHDLVIVSRAMAQDIPESRDIRQALASLQLEKSVHLLTDVPSQPISSLVGLYGGADWYVQPSLYEGFGLPVLEAMTCGAPVISTTGGSLTEITGQAAITCSPTSNDLAAAMKQATSISQTERQKHIDLGFEQANRFSWKETARQTAKVYQSVIEQHES